MIIIGLTGSIGMGKSTTSNIFREEGYPVYDADAEVAAMYSASGEAVVVIKNHYPEVVVDGAVDRNLLSAIVLEKPEVLQLLEKLLHPLLKARRDAFVNEAEQAGHKLVVLDIPLLFEAGLEREVDVVVVVSAPEELQRQRVLARPGMTQEKLDLILARQLPDLEKRAKANFVVSTDVCVEDTRRQIKKILGRILSDI